MRIQRHAKRLTAVLLSGLLMAAQAAADQFYRPWASPDSGAASDARLQDFVDRLNAIVDKAEQSRAADPRLLRDLRDLARGYDRPWRRQVLVDDFGDGDFTHNPAWTVTAGHYWVERGWGLRSAVQGGSAAAGDDRRLTGKEAAAAIFGQILNQAINPQGAGGAAAPGGDATTAIHTRIAITNAFAVQLDMSSWPLQGGDQGRLEFGLYQGAPVGAAPATGYFVAYAPGGAFELLRVGRRGASVIDRRVGPALEDQKTHRIEWTRGADGTMTIAVDGRTLLATRDRGLMQPFDGFLIVNRGGDYIVRRVAVSGT